MCTICDMEPQQQRLSRILGVCEERPYFHHPTSEEPVFFMYDPPHLIKSLRNALMNYDIGFGDGSIASWNFLKTLWSLDTARSLRLVPRLTAEHIFLGWGRRCVSDWPCKRSRTRCTRVWWLTKHADFCTQTLNKQPFLWRQWTIYGMPSIVQIFAAEDSNKLLLVEISLPGWTSSTVHLLSFDPSFFIAHPKNLFRKPTFHQRLVYS